MLYEPKFCCECGEKIERVDRNLLTSRRFCEICDRAFVVQDKTPLIIAVCGVLIGLFGVGSYFQKPEMPNVAPSQFISKGTQNTNRVETNRVNSSDSNPQTKSQSQTNNSLRQTINESATTQNLTTKKPIIASNSTQEVTYFCGAATKKGTPCSRRVKGGGRCWQHEGQPAMLPQEKLIVNNN